MLHFTEDDLKCDLRFHFWPAWRRYIVWPMSEADHFDIIPMYIKFIGITEDLWIAVGGMTAIHYMKSPCG